MPNLRVRSSLARVLFSQKHEWAWKIDRLARIGSWLRSCQASTRGFTINGGTIIARGILSLQKFEVAWFASICQCLGRIAIDPLLVFEVTVATCASFWMSWPSLFF